MLVGVDDSRRRMVCSAERFGSESARQLLHRVLAETKKSIVAPVVRKSVYVWDNQSEQARR
jgi:hypothetical protein